MNTREAFLRRVHQATVEGNRVGPIPALPERGGAGYQGGGPNPAERFCQELRTAGGVPHLAPDRDAAVRTVLDLIKVKACRKILVGRGGAVERLGLAARLRHEGLEVYPVDGVSEQSRREVFFGADLGI